MRNIVIYGIGKIGRRYVDQCVECQLSGLKLVDSSNDMWGEQYNGMRIYSPREIVWGETDLVVVTVSDTYWSEILEQLVGIYRVLKEKIVFWRETMILSPKEIYNFGNMILNEPIDEGMILTGKELGKRLRQDSFNDLEKFYFNGTHRILNKWMHYFAAYDRFFSKYRGKDISILEIGVFKGGSLQMWKNYFQGPQNIVKVYGIDIDSQCKKYEDNNIEIMIGSQEDRNFLQEVKKRIGKVDILIDDGGHTMRQQIITFEELFDLVDDNGIYLCEDVHTSYMKQYMDGSDKLTFMEYSWKLIDSMHRQYSETDVLPDNSYAEQIKCVSYWDSMIFIEKKKKTTKATCVCI